MASVCMNRGESRAALRTLLQYIDCGRLEQTCNCEKQCSRIFSTDTVVFNRLLTTKQPFDDDSGTIFLNYNYSNRIISWNLVQMDFWNLAKNISD